MFKNIKTLVVSLSIVLALSLVPSMCDASVPDPIIDLGFNEGSGTTTVNSGTAGGELTLSTPMPMWSSNVPPGGGASSLDFGTTAGGYYADSLTNYSELAGLEKFTVTLWVNCTDSTIGSGGNRLVCWNAGQNGDGLDLVYLSTGGLHMSVNEWPDWPNNRPTRSSEGMIPTDAAAGPDNWRFIALTYDSTLASEQVTYYFGSATEPAAKDVAITYAEGGAVGNNIQPLAIGNFAGNQRNMTGRQFRGLIDEVKIFGDALTLEQIQSVQIGTQGLASSPNPENESTEISRDVVLSWTPGTINGKSDVYFGTNFDDVNDGIAVRPNQDTNSYDPGRLEFSTTYFWRIDDVNSSDSTVTTGAVWSFTVESLAYPISGESIIATASSNEEGKGPENTVNGSGLNANDFHSTDVTKMWLSSMDDQGPVWIEYEFDKVYKLHEMQIWNYNGQSVLTMFGLKDITIEYSSDGSSWTQLTDVPEVAAATGTEDYTYNTTVAFDGAAVKFVKITANSNWSNGLFSQYGLSEVRFMYIPTDARYPLPEDGATDIAIDTTLGWRAGREAAEHNAYISKDEQSVIDGTVPAVTVSEASYGPLSLDLSSVYYWRVDEVNNANAVPVWEGTTWSFTTSEYLVVDDFESYNDIPEGQEGSNLVYLTWIDGFDNPSINGSTMGYPTGSSMETNTVHGGRQSAPVLYDNTSASLSEVTVRLSDLPIGQDWTSGSPAELTLWFYGDPNNAGTDRMYVKVNGTRVTYDGNLTQAQWQEFSVDLSSLGINLGNVTILTIGFESSGSGMVFIDDILLYAPLE